jgi:replicative DNA helicase
MTETMMPMFNVLLEFNKELEELFRKERGSTDPDMKTCGFQNADLIIGRPSMGKSAFTLQVG